MALLSKVDDDHGPDGVRALDERIPWERCDGIEHVFYDDAGNEIYHHEYPPPQSANAVKAQAANESSEERQQNEFEKEGKS